MFWYNIPGLPLVGDLSWLVSSEDWSSDQERLRVHFRLGLGFRVVPFQGERMVGGVDQPATK